MMHCTGEKGETRWCTLIMVADPKFVGLRWKSPSNDFQDPRESWGDAQDTEKVE